MVREDFFRSWKDRKQEADCPDELTDAFEAPEETPNVPGSPDETPVVFEGREEDRGMIVYTSGSAGAPKGILYTRGNIDAQIIRKQSCVKDIHPLVFAASATMSFCLTVTEYFRTLTMGGHVHMLSDEVRADGILSRARNYQCIYQPADSEKICQQEHMPEEGVYHWRKGGQPLQSGL